VLGELERRPVRPVEIVEGEDERLAGGKALDQLTDRVVRQVALRRRRRRVGLRRQRAQSREDHRQLRGAVGCEPVEGARVERGEVDVEGVDREPERQVALELGGAALEHQALTLVAAAGQFRQQPCLADPRLATDDQQAGRVAGQGLIEQPTDELQFAIAPDQRHRRFDHP
jgi:hypothetical protein